MNQKIAVISLVAVLAMASAGAIICAAEEDDADSAYVCPYCGQKFDWFDTFLAHKQAHEDALDRAGDLIGMSVYIVVACALIVLIPIAIVLFYFIRKSKKT